MDSFTYSAYQDYFAELVSTKSTSGNNPSEALIYYTKLNWSRAKRNDKSFNPLPQTVNFLESLEKRYLIKVITEPWCGDSAQIVPAIAGVANLSEKLAIEVVLRDENEDLMNRYLTNGGKSIPIAIIIDEETGKELGSWGPRPTEAQEMVTDYKNKPASERPSYDEFVQVVQKWYNADKTVSIQKEFIGKFKGLIK